MRGDGPIDLENFVVVPHDAGPLVPLATIDGPRSDVDEALDDMFGQVDDDGPGVTDAVLLAGGAAAVIAAHVAALPAIVLVGGLAGIGLGSVLPVRSGLRRFRRRRIRTKVDALVGAGRLLDVRHQLVADLLADHAAVFDASARLSDVHALRARNVAHALITEVAMLLDGHRLIDDAEAAYVAERNDALRSLLSVVIEATQDASGVDRDRAAQVRARRQVEATSSQSALWEADELTHDLLADPNV